MKNLLKLSLSIFVLFTLNACEPKFTLEEAQKLLLTSPNLVDADTAENNLAKFRKEKMDNSIICANLPTDETILLNDLKHIISAAERSGATALVKTMGLVTRVIRDDQGEPIFVTEYDTYFYFLLESPAGSATPYRPLEVNGRPLFFNELTRCPRFCNVFDHELPALIPARIE